MLISFIYLLITQNKKKQHNPQWKYSTPTIWTAIQWTGEKLRDKLGETGRKQAELDRDQIIQIIRIIFRLKNFSVTFIRPGGLPRESAGCDKNAGSRGSWSALVSAGERWDAMPGEAFPGVEAFNIICCGTAANGFDFRAVCVSAGSN